MKNLLPALAVLVLLPASLWAGGAQSDLNNCAANSNDQACFGSSNMPQPSAVDASGSTPEQNNSQLSRSSGQQMGSYYADVPCAKPGKTHHPLGFIKKHGKLILGTLAAGGGAYFGFTHMAAFASLGGPWGAAAMGAVGAFILAAFVLPKIFGLFHHHHKHVD